MNTEISPERRSRRLLAVTFLLVWIPVACRMGASKQPAERRGAIPGRRDGARDRELEETVFTDQYGDEWRGADVLRGPAVLILGTPGSAEVNTRWDSEVVRPCVGGSRIAVHRAVDLRGYPRFAAGLIASKIRHGTSPPGTPVLLDWDGTLTQRLEAGTGQTTVLLLDSGGTERFRSSGEPDADSAAELREAIRLDLEAGRPRSRHPGARTSSRSEGSTRDLKEPAPKECASPPPGP